MRCALLADGAVRCWGWGGGGGLGYGNTLGCVTESDQCYYGLDFDPHCCVGDDESPADAGNVPYE